VESFKKGAEHVFFCPHHSHHKAKLSVNLDKDTMHCWICGWAGKTLFPIFRMVGGEDLQLYLNSIGKKRDTDEEDKKYDTPLLPEDFRLLVSSIGNNPYRRAAVNYVRSRGLSDLDMLRFKLGYCESGEYRYRVIIPSFDANGELNFFVGRKFYDHIGLSYKHGNFDKDIIFNEYLIDWDEPVILTEGPFDAMKAGTNAISLQGTILRQDMKLFHKIVSSGTKVYVALDADANKKQLGIITALMEHDVEVLSVSLGGAEDLGAMTKEEISSAIVHARPVGSKFDMLRLRVSA